MTTDGTLVEKLAPKIRMTESDPERVMLTNVYLSTDNDQVLAALPAGVITKIRWAISWAGTGLAIDQFVGHLSVLLLAEPELGPDDQLLGMPYFAVRDVTNDDRSSGDALATAEPVWLSAVLTDDTRDSPA